MDILSNIFARLSEIHPLLGLAGIFACIFAPVVLLAVLTHRFVQGRKKSNEPDRRERREITEKKPAPTQNAAIETHKAAIKATPKVSVLIILASLLGCLGLPSLFILRENSWHKIYPLPEKAAAIFVNGDRIYIRTQGEETYSCVFLTPKIDGSQPITCTKLPPESVNTETLPHPRCERFHPTPPSAPDQVIASDEVCAEYVDYGGFTKYVVRKDGSVWFWSTGYSMMGSNTSLCMLAPIMGLGAVIGLVVGGVIVAAIKVYRQVKKPAAHKATQT
jgi:hypothetical protein